MERKRTEYSRKIWMIDKKLQWSIVVYTVAISALTTGLHMAVDRLANHGFGGYAIFIFASFNTFLVMFSMWISNRLVGPIYRFRKTLEDAGHGGKIKKVYFRRWDYFKDLNHVFNAYVDSLPANLKEEPGQKAAATETLGNQKGMTLVELLMALAIITILSAIGVSTFMNPGQDFSYKKDVTNFHDALISARNVAFVRGQCAVAQVIKPSTMSIKTYSIPSPCSPPYSHPDLQYTYTFSNGSISSFTDQSGNQSDYLIFAPNGKALASSATDIKISQTGGNALARKFRIYPAIGQIVAQ